jgi:TolB protein
LASALFSPSPSFAKEKELIYFESARWLPDDDRMDTGVYRMNPDGTNIKRITDGRTPDLSPDGKKLLYSTNNGDIMVSDPNGKNPVKIGTGSYARWSKDGSKIVFERHFDIWLMNADGSDPVQLTQTEPFYNSSPDISPDGTKIVFHSDRDGRNHIYVMNIDGSDVKQLTGDASNETAEFDARWSPDGSKILYTRYAFDGTDVYVMDADGSNPTNLTSQINEDLDGPVWSPDGTRITFSGPNVFDGNENQVWTMNADGSNVQTFETYLPNVVLTDWAAKKKD